MASRTHSEPSQSLPCRRAGFHCALVLLLAGWAVMAGEGDFPGNRHTQPLKIGGVGLLDGEKRAALHALAKSDCALRERCARPRDCQIQRGTAHPNDSPAFDRRGQPAEPGGPLPNRRKTQSS